MLHTYLTDRLGLRYPIVGAPMAGVGGGRLARAITRAGGIGMIGIGSGADESSIARECAIARGEDGTRFGIGLMVWAIERRPELLEAALAERPYLLSLSFGSLAPYARQAHEAGCLIATQVNSVAAAREAERSGADLIVAQGTEAGGHTGHVGTLPLLQAVLDAVRVPVLAAGGIASARGLAAVLAAGADGAWMGTAFLACPECENTAEARRRVIAASEGETVLTHAFDWVQGLAWPRPFPGRALRNRFTETWHERADDLIDNESAAQEYRQARTAGNHDVTVIYAGEAVGLIREERPAAEVVTSLAEDAESLLRHRSAQLLSTLP